MSWSTGLLSDTHIGCFSPPQASRYKLYLLPVGGAIVGGIVGGVVGGPLGALAGIKVGAITLAAGKPWQSHTQTIVSV